MIPPEERDNIVRLLRDGGSIHGVAKQTGRAKGTVSSIARSSGIERTPQKTWLRDYTIERRLALLNAAFEKAEEVLESVDRPSQLMQWAIAFGTLTDKRRLEDGEATSRSEVTNVDDARTRVASKLVQLAQRRGTRDVAS